MLNVCKKYSGADVAAAVRAVVGVQRACDAPQVYGRAFPPSIGRAQLPRGLGARALRRGRPRGRPRGHGWRRGEPAAAAPQSKRGSNLNHLLNKDYLIKRLLYKLINCTV